MPVCRDCGHELLAHIAGRCRVLIRGQLVEQCACRIVWPPESPEQQTFDFRVEATPTETREFLHRRQE